ncbi:MAG: PAS domain S-box protein [Cyclobacteriaceae bacterium]
MGLLERDIEALKNEVQVLQERLESSQQKYFDQIHQDNFHLKELFDSSSDLIQIFSPAGEFQFVNEAWRNKLGYREKELSDLKFVDVIHPDHQKSTLENLLRTSAGSRLERFETVLKTKSGKNIYVIGKLTAVFKDDSPIEFRCVFFDITERFRAERAQSLYYKIANITISKYSNEDFYEKIFLELNEILKVKNFSVYLKKGIEYDPIYRISEEKKISKQAVSALEKLLANYTFERGKPLIIYGDGIEKIASQKKVRLSKKPPSIWLGVLIYLQKSPIGVLSIESSEDQSAYNHKDLELLDFISGQIAIALEREQNTKKIQNQGARINAIFESSTHQIWSINRDFEFTSFNKNYAQAFQEYYGIPPKHGMSLMQNGLDLMEDNSLEFWKEKYNKVFEGKALHFETCQKKPNGEMVWRDIYLNPIESVDGKVTEISSIANDITEKKRSDTALKESEEKFRNIFESFQDIYFRCTENGIVSMVSPSVEKVLGYSQKDVLGRPISDFFISKSNLNYLLKNLYQEVQIQNFEGVLTRKDGRRIQVLSNVRLINKTADGFEIEGVARDFTAIKETNQQLREAKEVAEKSLKVRERFLANMSHEIRTPMNGIIGMIDLIGSTKLNKEQSDYIRTIKKSSDNLLNILNDILDLSKIEAGKMELRKHPVKLFDTFKKIYDLYSQQAHLSGNSLFYHLDNEVPEYIMADETRLIQVLSNLTSNAIKFSPASGNINLSLRIANKSEDGWEFKVSIKDSGIGINQEDINKLFKSFSQIDSSSSKNYSGTGLGLVISKELVKSMEGEIGVASTPGLGSTFWFTFKGETYTPQKPEKAKSEKAFVKQFTEAAPKILLVDDNDINRKVAKSILKKSGCKVQEADSGFNAIKQVKKHHFDMVFMDIQMPDMDGIAATKELKKLKNGKQVPVVAMTAYAMAEDQSNFLKEGMDDYIAKPIKANNLIDKVKKWLTFEPKSVSSEVFEESTEQLVINQNTLNHLHKYGGEELIKSVLIDFENEADEQIRNINNWIADSNIDAVKKELHTLKGNAGTLGIERLSAQAQLIEAKLKNGDMSNLASEVKKLTKNFKEFKANHKNFFTT